MKTRLAALALILACVLMYSHAEPQGEDYLVVLKGGKSIGLINKLHGTQTIRQVPNTSIYLIHTDNSDDHGVDNLLLDLKKDDNIDLAEKNSNIKLAAADESSLDPTLVDQMTSLLDGQTLTTFYGATVLKTYIDQPAVAITQLNQARGLSTGAATRVAYIDTGVDYTHPAIRPWLDPGIDLVTNQTASELDGLSQQMASLLDDQMTSLLDKRFFFVLNQAMTSLLDGEGTSSVLPPDFGHGTLVAGIIHLFAPEARIVPIKAFDAYGNTSLFTIVDAIYRARDLSVDVLNMSFSIDGGSAVLQKAITDAQGSGIGIVASAGNNASDSRNVYPAAYAQVVGVAATDFNDHLASFSNYGKSVSVVAPGAFVVSTVPGGKYAAAWGTSFSAPIVSGTIALLDSGLGHGQSDSSQVITTADFIDNLNPGFENKLGKGRINVRRALKSRN